MANLVHGGDIYSAEEKGLHNVLDFSANINPAGLPKRVKQAIIEGLDSCVNYPDPLCRELMTGIAEFEQIQKNHIICGNGAADVIFRLVLAIKPLKALVLAPTFAEYEIALNSVGCEVKQYYLEEKEEYQLKEDIIHHIDSSLDMIFLCNPNNPTGQLIEKSLLEKILQKCVEQKILLVIDECFMDFVIDYDMYSMKKYTEMNENLFILKAFTKSYAMPGLRLGYGLCCNLHLLNQIAAMGQPWSVSNLAQIAGIQALKEKEYIEESIKQINLEKEYLVSELDKLRIKHYKPAANYILLNLNTEQNRFNIESFKESLLGNSILVRDCSNYVGLRSGFYRIAVKEHQANERLIKVLKSMLNNL